MRLGLKDFALLKRSIFILLVSSLIFCFEIRAEETILESGAKGIWFHPGEHEDASFLWEAKWIWMQEQSASEVMLTRRLFEISQNPDKAFLRISASSIYQLYINGQYICRGPARSAPHHQSYDILDVTTLLRQGENLIAVRVHHQQGKFSYHHKGRPGLLVQLNLMIDGIPMTITSDENWSTSSDPSWSLEAPVINRFQQVINDRADMRSYQSGWTGIDFEDTNWKKARPLMRHVGWPSPQSNASARALTPPWTSLVPRDIPYLEETVVNATNIVLVKTLPASVVKQLDEGLKMDMINIDGSQDQAILKKFSNYLNGSEPGVIPGEAAGDSRFILFDFGEVLNGMPILKIAGKPGTIVDVLCAPFIIDHAFTHQVVDSDFRDRVTLSGKIDTWEATYFKPARYMGIVIHGADEPVILHFAGIRMLRYPFQKPGGIESDDAPWIREYAQAAAKTIEVCTTDGYTDNYRERRQYAQTGYYAAMGNYWLFGDQALQRRYLIQVAQEQEANGIMPAYAPLASDDYMIILDSNCLWIRSLYNYFLYSGDVKTVANLLPAARKLMALLHSYTNSMGMIENPPYAYWLDHALNDRRGANFALNGHYLGALEGFARILDWLSKSNAQVFEERAHVLRHALQTNLWDEKRGLFADALIDGERSEMFSEHANAMALAMHIATPEQAMQIADEILAEDDHDYIKRASGITMVTPAMSYFLHKGLCANGFIEGSFDLFRRRFDKMLKPESNGTLWEEWWLDAMGRSGVLQKGRTRSDAQTESAFPPALFAEFLLGVTPAKPGMKEVVIERQNSGLRHVRGVVPSPMGELKIEWNLEDRSRRLALEIPDGMIVKVDIKSLNSENTKYIFHNEKRIRLSVENNPSIVLGTGRQQLEF
jgi:alpha-L-rhamnosidase